MPSDSTAINGILCPLCLTIYGKHESGPVCPGCQAGGRSVALMKTTEYLAQVEWELVERYWKEQSGAPAPLVRMMLDRLGHLRQLADKAGVTRPLTGIVLAS